MAARRGPTIPRRQLGGELRRLRENSGLIVLEAAQRVGISETKLSKVERGLAGLPKISDLEALLELYGVTNEEDVEFLLDTHRQSLGRGWWTPYRSFMPSGMATYIGLESEARGIRAWQPNVVLGLLQTERYARALFEAAKPVDEHTTEFVERNVRLRMERKDAILRETNPIELWCVLDEAALQRRQGSVEVMVEQYEEVARLTQFDNVTVQILPLASTANRPTNSFSMLDFEPSLPPAVVVDGPSGTVSVVERDHEIWTHARRIDNLRAAALAPDETPRFLEDLTRKIAS
ncbi:helix-turn-helix domain-containing protein [Streptomyces hainanensis]|uniref:XRE family transcriptional regulator n=1 Tax=Streptomyces hainanensis TaxID=402648 RepID=A0A4V2Y232_9ACTN|nr:helix-turn-helix transcriptional regulator [Streptomyces hainanensis]TDC71085.1 XRE family transcriptional regulator [Streptomyces hainanensis]